MSTDQSGIHFQYTSRRIDKLDQPAQFHAQFDVKPSLITAQPGTLLQWLTERYALFTTKGRAIVKGSVFHKPWTLQNADADVITNTVADSFSWRLSDHVPFTHYSKSQDAYFLPFQKEGTL
ncbi:DUF2071 domain-containing protein [Halobacillus salinarum]|uniref:DUF2071 domain-containing protein n=1 Tax=Halobacillus salinarum TaxID=2932257 RepID=A0ABY4ESS1_9BACI|nr:DUF2071 domain-containing protein [Halobacillus salinarum]